MRTNTAQDRVTTHEGGTAVRSKPLDELRRSVMACLLWEDGFYETGVSVADRIKTLVPQCQPHLVAELAIEAREKMKLRHAPLLLVRELARDSKRFSIGETLTRIIQRVDEIPEFLSIYWKDGHRPIAKQVKKGLARAFAKFNEHQLAKYDRETAVKLRDVAMLVHVKPKDELLMARLINKTHFPEKTKGGAAIRSLFVDGATPGLATPDTWEVALSTGADKRATFERLLSEGQLGYMALLKNLRNMQEAGVDAALVRTALMAGAARSKALPFRFISAARACVPWEPMIDEAMQIAVTELEKLSGETAILVDVSASMNHRLSYKSDLSRLDTACALAILGRAMCESCRVFTFSSQVREVPARAGMALADAIVNSQPHANTHLKAAINAMRDGGVKSDRIIVITDEQSQDGIAPPIGKGYVINVATDQRGVAYGPWTSITGFSEAVMQYIIESEKMAEPA